MLVEICEKARREIRQWPVSVRQSLGSVLQRLQDRELVGMPDVRSLALSRQGCIRDSGPRPNWCLPCVFCSCDCTRACGVSCFY